MHSPVALKGDNKNNVSINVTDAAAIQSMYTHREWSIVILTDVDSICLTRAYTKICLLIYDTTLKDKNDMQSRCHDTTHIKHDN